MRYRLLLGNAVYASATDRNGVYLYLDNLAIREQAFIDLYGLRVTIIAVPRNDDGAVRKIGIHI